MRLRRLVTLLLGGWLGASLFMNWIAAGIYDRVDDVVNSSSALAQREIRATGAERSRELLTYQASEQVRFYFDAWEQFQLFLAVLLLILFLFATSGEKMVMIASLGMLVIVVLLHWTVTPQLIELGRAIDFTSADQLVPERQAFYSFQRAYSVLEVVKFCLGLVLALRLSISTREVKRKRKRKVNEVDHADHRHVDR